MMHMRERIAQRVSDTETQAYIERLAIEKAHKYSTGSAAILVGRVPEAQGTLTYEADGTGISNGTMAVIIVRDGRIVTFMWRREAQPWTCEALRVDKVVPCKVTQG